MAKNKSKGIDKNRVKPNWKPKKTPGWKVEGFTDEVDMAGRVKGV